MAEHEKNAMIPYLMIDVLGSFDNIYETRLFAWILAKAQCAAKKYDYNMKSINVQFALDMVQISIPVHYILPPNDHSYNNVHKADGLANKTIRYERNDIEYQLNIIAFPHVSRIGRKSFYTCTIHNALWVALLDFSKGFRVVKMSAFLSLKNPAAMILYLLISNQHDIKYYTCSELRTLMGATAASYKLIHNFRRRVLEPARDELTEKAPYTCEFRYMRGNGRGGATTTIVVKPIANDNYKQPDERLRETVNAQRLRVDSDIQYYLQQSLGLTAREIERVEPLIADIGDKDTVMDRLTRVRETTRSRPIKNMAAYVCTALANP